MMNTFLQYELEEFEDDNLRPLDDTKEALTYFGLLWDGTDDLRSSEGSTQMERLLKQPLRKRLGLDFTPPSSLEGYTYDDAAPLKNKNGSPDPAQWLIDQYLAFTLECDRHVRRCHRLFDPTPRLVKRRPALSASQV
jgi:hypothetical protein